MLVTFDGHAEATLGAVRSLGGSPGPWDLAVGELDHDISDLVEVYKIRRIGVADGSPAVIVGWGCIAQAWSDFENGWMETNSGGQLKRFREVTYTSDGGLRENAGCRGDSGGPTFERYPESGDFGGIIGVSSYVPKPDEDGYTRTMLADPIRYADQIEAFCVAPDTKHQGCNGPNLGGPGIDYECGDGNRWVAVGGWCENIHH